MTDLTLTRQLLGLLVWLGLCLLVAGIGAIASVNAPAFYAELNQPGWAPPAGVFGPVWTALFLMMAVSAWLVWRLNDLSLTASAQRLFITQLVFNALWSWLFFTWHQGALALLNIVVLWLLIGATLVRFWRLQKLAGLLLVPYWLWVSFAAVLNYATWQLNPDLL